MRRVAAAVIFVTTAARADALDTPVGARVTGRAGAALLAADDGSALLGNPANLARRTGTRVQVGLAAIQRGVEFVSNAAFPAGSAPAVENTAGVTLSPWVSVQAGLGSRVVVAAAAFAPSTATVRFPTTYLAYDASRDDRAAFPARYAGTRVELDRRGGGVGAAVRVLPWLAAGVSLLAYRVDARHDRVVWGGPAGPLALGDLSPAYDMNFGVRAHDAFVPGAAAGLVIAPLDLPFELGAAALWTDTARLDGRPTLGTSRGPETAIPVVDPGATASMALAFPAHIRAGARALLPRLALELDFELSPVRDAPPAWTVEGVSYGRDGIDTPVDTVPLGPTPATAWSLRASADVEVVPSEVSLLAGYAFTRSGLERASASPLVPDGDTHTLALGLEARAGGGTVTLAASRTIRPSTNLADATLRVVGAPEVRAAAGTLSSSATVVALDVELGF